MKKSYYVYILSNIGDMLYVGVTYDIVRRVAEHKAGKGSKYTSKYGIKRLIYLEETDSIEAAIEREKQIKGWKRNKKLDLIKEMNPKFEDLSIDWYEK